jgi:uroporphyrinogen decarboxylase
MVANLKNDLVLRAARRQRTERTPVWMMRQAGRFDPEYRRIRERAKLPLEELFRTPDVATEISLLPRRLGVDAVIFFGDILIPLAPMGAEFVFRPGPVLDRPIRTTADIDALRPFDAAEKLPFVGRTLRHLSMALRADVPLLGFAGGPLTLLFFLVEGGSPGSEPRHALALLREAPAAAHRLLARLADMTAEYLAYQIECGAQAVQLFESNADLVTAAEYREFAHPYHVRVFERLERRVPTILFAKGHLDLDLMAASGADVLSLGTGVDLAEARRKYGRRVALQGNVDNRLLATGTPDQVEAATRDCIAAGGHEGHILNLSHGILKETPFENACRLINTAHSLKLGEVGQ